MAVAGYNSLVVVASLPSVAFTTENASTSDLTTFTIINQTKRYFDKSVPTVVQKGQNEVQTLTITGGPTGGTFTLTFGGNTTETINWNDNAATAQTRLQALASIGAGNCTVTGGPGPSTPFVVEFTNTLGPANQALITLSNNLLTGGTTPSVSIVETFSGSTYATITAGFTLFRCNARVVFPTAQQQGTVIRFQSGNYFPYATLAEAASCEFSGKMNTEETTTFVSAQASNGAKSFTPTTLEGTLKYGSFWINIARAQSLVARDFLIVSFQTPPGNRYEGFCYASDCNIKTDAGRGVTQDLVFQLTDEFFNS